jgi:hypothetical protein
LARAGRRLFTRGAFAELMKPQDELLPVISPLGYAAEKKSVVEKIVAAGADRASANRITSCSLTATGQAA